MSTQIVDETGKPVVTEPHGDGNRRGQWMLEAKQVREPNRIKYWRQKRADLLRESESIVDKATAADRGFTPGEESWIAQNRGDVEFCNGRIAEFQDAQAEAMYILPTGRNCGFTDSAFSIW